MELLTNVIQPYAWGSRSAIAALQGREPADSPEAELWMGTHTSAPSRIDRAGGPEDGTSLLDCIQAAPLALLGRAVLEEFGPRLPYLLKVLAADRALSVQVHPTPEQARAGFAAEDALGVARDAAQRNYRDPYAKPELIVALTPFVGLCGFRAATDLVTLLRELAVPALKPLADALDAAPGEEAVRETLEALLRWPEHERGALIADVTQACGLPQRATSRFAETYAWTVRVAADFPGDIGLVVMLMLNLVTLAPGEAVFLRPRTLHAYLSGVGVEIMAGSDNVLRGGLTPKHIDVDELLSVLEFSNGPLAPTPATPVSPAELAWVTPTPEFRLSRVTVSGEPIELAGGLPQILLCIEGPVQIADGDQTVDLTGGQSVFVPASSPGVRLTASAATVFRATPGI